MLAKYIPGAIWAPAARVVAVRRAGVTDAALVTSSMLLEAGLSAVAGVIVFVVSLPFVDEVNAPLVPLHRLRRRARRPRPAAGLPAGRAVRCCASSATRRICRTCARRTLSGAARLLRWHVVARRLRALAAAALGRRASGGVDDRLPRRRGGRRRDRRRRLRLRTVGTRSRARPRCTGCCSRSPRPGQALGAVALNRVALTLVELIVLFVGGFVLRGAATGSSPSSYSRPSSVQCTS